MQGCKDGRFPAASASHSRLHESRNAGGLGIHFMFCRLVLSTLLALAFGKAVAADGVPRIRPGWTIQLLAGAPEIQHPAAIATAPDGRIFVAEDPMDIRTERADVTEGRILCFHPDGRRTVYVESIGAAFGLQYLDGRLYALHNPFFSVWEDAGDHGAHRVDLVRNTNPNWHALGWNDHVPANFRLGLDGRFYVATGDKGLFGAAGTDGKRFDFFGGGIFRMRPDGTALESFSTGVRNILDVALDAEDNAFTFDNTDEHEWMGRLTYMVDGGFYGYPHDFIPRRPYTLWCLADFGAGAATAVVASSDDALPEAYRGNLFLADFGKRNVLRVPLARAGASWAVRGTNGLVPGVAGMNDVEELFLDPPEDFRPVGLAFTPDGRSLILGDWQHRDVKDAQARVGRLWKLTWTGTGTRVPVPEWYVPAATGKPFRADDAALIAGLRHPSRDIRHCAQRRLSERAGAPGTADLLLDVAGDRSEPFLARIHALWALVGQSGGLSREQAARCREWVLDPDDRFAAQAARWVGESGDASGVEPLLKRLAGSSAPLRFQAATAVGRIGGVSCVPALQSLLTDSDAWVRYAAFHALNRIGQRQPEAWALIAKGLASPIPAVAEGTRFALRSTHAESLMEALAVIRADPGQPAAARLAAAQLLADACRKSPPWNGEWWAYHPFRTPPPAHTMEWSGSPRVRTELIRALQDLVPAVRQVAAGALQAESQPESQSALRFLLDREPDAGVRATVLESLAQQGDPGVRSRVVTWLASASADPAETRAALRAAAMLGGADVSQSVVTWLDRADAQRGSELWNSAVDSAAQLKATGAVPRLQKAAESGGVAAEPAVQALGRIGGDSAHRALLDLLNTAPMDLRRAALVQIAQLPGAPDVPELLEAWKQQELQADALLALAKTPDIRALDAYLVALASKNTEQRAAGRKAVESIRAVARAQIESRVAELPPGALAELRSIYRDDPAAAQGPLFRAPAKAATPEAYLEFAMAHPGDATRGERLFRDTSGLNCMGCHRIRGQGADVGPDLSTMGAQFGSRELAESILWPSRVVREGYQAVLVELKDGEEVSGLVKGESGELLTLRDSAGRLRQIPKTDVVSRRASDQSLMPEGLQAGLTLQEFADLIAFASSCRNAN